MVPAPLSDLSVLSAMVVETEAATLSLSDRKAATLFRGLDDKLLIVVHGRSNPGVGIFSAQEVEAALLLQE